MTEYIKNQLIKLCDHPEWFNDMLISLDNNPEEPHTAIRNYLSHVQLNGLLENTEIVHVSFNGDEPKPGFYFEIPKDLIYIPHQDTWTEHFPNPGSNKNDYTLYLSDPQAQYNKLLRTQQKLRNKKK